MHADSVALDLLSSANRGHAELLDALLEPRIKFQRHFIATLGGGDLANSNG
jgi:hypothetical protein